MLTADRYTTKNFLTSTFSPLLTRRKYTPGVSEEVLIVMDLSDGLHLPEVEQYVNRKN
jgi:hypothetical protein